MSAPDPFALGSRQDADAPSQAKAHDLIPVSATDISTDGAALILLRAVLTVEAGEQPLSRAYILDTLVDCQEALQGTRVPRRSAFDRLN